MPLVPLILATRNPGKVRELASALAAYGFDVQAPPQDMPDVEETGTTFADNALLKASAAASWTGCPALADDSGLEVDALDKGPGVYSARWLGHDTPYTEKNRMVLEKLREAGAGQRGARFVCAICGVLENGEVLHTEGVMEGEIAKESSGENGFGYDPIFWLPEYGMTSAQISREEKNRISHRGKALRAMKALLAERQRV